MDTPLSEVLRKIEAQTKVKFSYNPALIQPGRRITMRFNKQPLGDVLKQLLGDPDISVHEIGDQVVLYHGNLPEGSEEIKPGLSGKIIPLNEKKKNPDTVYVTHTDTIAIHKTDTVVRTINTIRIDTLKVHDTIFMYRTQKAGKRLKNFFSDNSVKRQKFMENNGPYAGLYLEPTSGIIKYTASSSEDTHYESIMSKANTVGPGKYSAGILIGYDYYRIGVRSGLGITKLGERFAYSYIKEIGGFFKTDTVERYYNLNGVDTTWYYVTDSSWVNKETQKFDYKNPNSYKYLDIPLSVKFRVWQNETTEIYALGGMNASLLLSSSALLIDKANEQYALWTETSQLSPAIFSWHAGIGGAYKIGSMIGVMCEATYRKQLTNQYKDLPLKKIYGLFALKFGAYIKF